ncbi:acyltransferase [Nocardioides sp. zg-1308]|uniref:acyltransferase family protein n=1 Tax=Nocardioides TaxID=1839 RepID=UPI0015536924|nr:MULTISPECIES: acyltransferase family protein [unclassified Nocardioides]NPD03415.1 acyltransferase [Nocardioides sp. zg-1308]WQQ21313.1 acyltransferase family protein [Nocardioides sp. S-34]
MPAIDHRPDVQGLRAVAVLLVVADHAGARLLAGGFVGVDVFFVLSGFLITSLLVREVAARDRISITGFYVRRALRILPAATVVLLVVTAWCAVRLAPVQVAEVGEDARWSAFFAANVHLAGAGEDYFDDDRAVSPFQHFWSLAVEEQFYLVWPLLLGLVVLVDGRLMRHVAPLLTVACLASLAWWAHLGATDPQQAYFSSAARAWELGLGALLAVLAPALVRLSRPLRTALGAVGLVAVLAAAVSVGTAAAPGTEWRIPLAVAGTAALLAAGTGGSTGATGALLASRPLTWLGDRSYSLYLWHWPVLVLGAAYVTALEGPTGTLVLLAVAAALTLASYHFVEQPFRRGRLVGRGPRALVMWPVALASVLVATTGAVAHADAELADRMGVGSARPAPLVAEEAPVAATSRPRGRRVPPLPQPRSVDDLVERAVEEARRGDALRFPMSNLPGLAYDSWHLAHPCNSPLAVERSRICPVGDPDGRTTVAVYGDSRAGQWLPAIDRLGRTEGLRVVPHVKYGCPPYPIRTLDGGGAEFHTCHAWRDWSRQRIRDLDPDVVLLSSDVMSWRMQAAPGLSHAQTWARGVGDLVDSLRRDGALVVVLGDIPVHEVDPESCLTTPGSVAGSCDLSATGWPAEPNAFTAATATAHGAAYVDVNRLSCADGRCPLVVSGTVTYSDESHLSVSWTRTLAGPLGAALRDAVGSLRPADRRRTGDRAPAGVWP